MFYSTALLSGSSPFVQSGNSYILWGVLKEEKKLMLHSFFQWDKILSVYLRTIWTRNKKKIPHSRVIEHHFLSLTGPTECKKPSQSCLYGQIEVRHLDIWMISQDYWTESLILDVHAHTKQIAVKWANVPRERAVHVCASQLQTAHGPRQGKC